MRVLIYLFCLCSFVFAEYEDLSKSTTYQEWLNSVQSYNDSSDCDEKCKQETIEYCNKEFSGDNDSIKWCIERSDFTGSKTYTNYALRANDTPMAISTMIENDDIDGLRAIIKAMPDLIGSSIKELEDEQGSSFVEKTFCYDDKIHLEALKILINEGELNPNIVSGEARICKDLPLVDYLAKKINESKGDLQARYKEALKILDSRDFKDSNMESTYQTKQRFYCSF